MPVPVAEVEWPIPARPPACRVASTQQVVRDGTQLGRVPADLANAVTDLAIAGPGVCGLRATARVLARVRAQRPDLRAPEARDAGGRIAWGLRSLFNVPEVMSLVRGPVGDESVYWRAVLDYSLDGNLQATLDEYAHVLPEWLGLLDRDAPVPGTACLGALMGTMRLCRWDPTPTSSRGFAVLRTRWA